MLLFTLSLLYAADTSDADVWATRTENAAVRLREAADQLAETASTIAQAGRVQRLAVLHSDSKEVAKRADQLLLWANQAPHAPTETSRPAPP